MALIAADAKDRAAQLIALTERLLPLIAAETAAMRAHADPPDTAEEKNRLANLYRQELARIAKDPGLLAGAPAGLKAALVEATKRLQAAVAEHQIALAAVREVSEGLVQALAEEIQRQRAGLRYGERGAPNGSGAGAAGAIALDKSA